MIQVSDSEDELDRFPGVRTFELVVACIASDSEEEEKEEEMLLERKNGLRELLAGRAKGSAPKDASGSQLPPALPFPPLYSVNPFALANLKKRKKDKEVVEEGSWSLTIRGFLQRCPRQPRAREELPQPRVRRISTCPRCAF